MKKKSRMQPYPEKKLSRGEFLRYAAVGAVTLAASQVLTRLGAAEEKAVSTGRPKNGFKGKVDLVAVKGEDPAKMTRLAVEKLGGMGTFVKKGAVVVIKPNIGWDRKPEYAGCTNPEVVATLVELAFNAGAKKVKVFDNTCHARERCYKNSGIRSAAEAKGASVFHVDDWNVVKAHFAYPSTMEGWPIYRDAVECDTFINVPVLKHHGLAKLTLAMKNLMGVCSGSRGEMHQEIGPKLVDLTDFIAPDLTVIDAFRMLDANGPAGGNLDDVRDTRTIIASHDSTLADIYAAKLAKRDPMIVPNIAEAVDRGFGITDPAKAKITEVKA